MVKISDINAPDRDVDDEIMMTVDEKMARKKFLLNTDQKTLPLKNFYDEVRGFLDVEHLLDNIVILVDVFETDFENIIRKMVLSFTFERIVNYMEIQNEIFSFADSSEFIARLGLPTNFGETLGDVQFILLVIAPLNQKDTKSALETAKTFSTLFTEPELRTRLLDSENEADFKRAIRETAIKLSKEVIVGHEFETIEEKKKFAGVWFPGRGIVNDFRRRLIHYGSDYRDGVRDGRSVAKTISATVFLYLSIVPTVIAFAMLNSENTNGLIMIYDIAESSGYDFFKMYTCTGIWCAIFLIIAAGTEASVVMKFARRSVEELFGLFISCALIFKAIMATVLNFERYDPNCSKLNVTQQNPLSCERSVGLLFFGLMIGTFWLSWSLYDFRKTPYLSKTKRELLVDYAAPISVIIMSFIGSFCFADIPKESFTVDYRASVLTFTWFWNQPITAHLICIGLGCPLAILFFMDQLLVTNTVDNKQNNLKKGAAPNWDLLVVALLNIFFSITGLPWTLGALPQSFLHLKAQADIEDRLVDGAMQQVVVKNRESRLAPLIAHFLMVPTYFFLLPYLQLIPTSVFHGLFLYLAISGMIGNEMCERILLLFTEQRSYPPLHYIRRVPQFTIHLFTLIEIIQLAILFYIGFSQWPVLEMTFPVVIFLFIPFRSLILPFFFSAKHLEALDGVH